MIAKSFPKAVVAQYGGSNWPRELKVALRQTVWARILVPESDEWDLPDPEAAVASGLPLNPSNEGEVVDDELFP